MKKNLNAGGRILRLLVAIILLYSAYFYHSWLLLAAAAFVFFEVLTSWCLFNQLFGTNQCTIPKK